MHQLALRSSVLLLFVSLASCEGGEPSALVPSTGMYGFIGEYTKVWREPREIGSGTEEISGIYQASLYEVGRGGLGYVTPALTDSAWLVLTSDSMRLDTIGFIRRDGVRAVTEERERAGPLTLRSTNGNLVLSRAVVRVFAEQHSGAEIVREFPEGESIVVGRTTRADWAAVFVNGYDGALIGFTPMKPIAHWIAEQRESSSVPEVSPPTRDETLRGIYEASYLGCSHPEAWNEFGSRDPTYIVERHSKEFRSELQGVAFRGCYDALIRSNRNR